MSLGQLFMFLPELTALAAIGVFWLLGWLVYSFTGRMSTADAMDIECCGLYWHFVDIVWIIIFPVVYLMEYAF